MRRAFQYTWLEKVRSSVSTNPDAHLHPHVLRPMEEKECAQRHHTCAGSLHGNVLARYKSHSFTRIPFQV